MKNSGKVTGGMWETYPTYLTLRSDWMKSGGSTGAIRSNKPEGEWKSDRKKNVCWQCAKNTRTTKTKINLIER
ncbi:hypothetical protein Phum_PHUM496060 [Pediculus humanus corporis]|uniref:Uncharacterized protein n=1 Tax=Pediculus humanus subsp. corporis TaxID=121224 RepID=E0VX72_PEDHC|nr:uncharacterized protein Phum_PHUM496060 [Pediculus humanus corporis]EEB17978.1 hypothetical protein Phum_PHUM496060 [Pediculus humanus corporis]